MKHEWPVGGYDSSMWEMERSGRGQRIMRRERQKYVRARVWGKYHRGKLRIVRRLRMRTIQVRPWEGEKGQDK